MSDSLVGVDSSELSMCWTITTGNASVSKPIFCYPVNVLSALWIEWRGKPLAIRCDNGPEHIGKDMVRWSMKHQITMLYNQLDKPTQNAYVERFNRTVRHEARCACV